jgi:anti-sigma regulatory factor (Ser/Thr protein kinase)/serine/threonine protein phosphatase PrpC
MAAAVSLGDARKSLEYTISVPLHGVAAQQSVRQLALTMGFSIDASEEITLAVAELTSNLIKHAGRGTLLARQIGAGERVGIEIEASDQGPGIGDIEKSFEDGYSTAGSLGYGLGTVNRAMDEVDISSAPDCGTQVTCRRWLRSEQRKSGRSAWEVGVVTRPRTGFRENGDAFVVKEWGDQLLVGLIDGLGHGELAQKAALAAQCYVQSHYDQPLDNIFLGAGRACRATRGVVMALARFHTTGQLEFASLGNIEVRVHSEPERLPLTCKRGYLGVAEMNVKVQKFSWNPEWLFVLHTDGLRTHWQWSDLPGIAQARSHSVAGTLMKQFASGQDDATVLAVRSRGPWPS